MRFEQHRARASKADYTLRPSKAVTEEDADARLLRHGSPPAPAGAVGFTTSAAITNHFSMVC